MTLYVVRGIIINKQKVRNIEMNEKNKKTNNCNCPKKNTDEEKIDVAAKEIMEKYRKAFEELAK